MNGGWGISYEIALRWMPLDLTDDKSTLVQVMAWCRQATKPLPEPMLTQIYGVTRPQRVKCSSWENSCVSITHCGLEVTYLDQHWPDGTKPLPEQMLTHQRCLCHIHLEQLHKMCAWIQSGTVVQTLPLKLFPHLPGVNELKLSHDAPDDGWMPRRC